MAIIITIDEIKNYMNDEIQAERANEYLKKLEVSENRGSMYELAKLLQGIRNKSLDEAVFHSNSLLCFLLSRFSPLYVLQLVRD